MYKSENKQYERSVSGCFSSTLRKLAAMSVAGRKKNPLWVHHKPDVVNLEDPCRETLEDIFQIWRVSVAFSEVSGAY